GLRASAEHGVAKVLGGARPDGGGGDRPSRGRARDRLFGTHAGRRRLLERAALHGDGLPARVLPALSRLLEILPAVGARALPQPQNCQYARGALRDVTRHSQAANRYDELRACRRSFRAQPWAVVASPDPLQPALLRTIENNDGPPSDPSAWLVGRAAGYGGQITFSRVS